MKYKVLIRVLIILLSTSAVLRSQTKLELTLEDCIKIGIDSNKVLKVDKSKLEFAEQKLKEVNTLFYPTLKFLGTYSRFSPIDPFVLGGGFVISPSILDNYTTKLMLNSPIFTGNRISGTSELNEYNIKAAKEDYNKDLAQLKYDIKNGFWNYYKAKQLQKSIDDNIKQVEAHLFDVQNLMNNGLATLNDVLKVKVQLSNVRLMKLDADNNIEIAMIGLANTMGISLNTQIELKVESGKWGEVGQFYQIPSLDVLVQTATLNRSEVKALQMRIKAAEASITVVKSGWYPQISVGANLTYANPNPRIFPTVEKFNTTWDVSLQLSYDIWNWKVTSYQTAQAEIVLDQNKIMLEQIKDGIVFEVKQVYLSLIKSQEKVKLAFETVKQAEENLRVTYDKFKMGLAINSDVVDAEYTLLNANITYVTSFVDYEVLYAKLQRSTEQ